MKQTAVEWLVEFMNNGSQKSEGIISLAFAKAKEMEKQQIFDTWDNGFDNGNYYGKYNENCEINCGEQYYNETYKSE
jgi:hypothetical protein